MAGPPAARGRLLLRLRSMACEPGDEAAGETEAAMLSGDVRNVFVRASVKL